ncbi:PAS domain-containing protein [Endothiovibrio diazotrophicus]
MFRALVENSPDVVVRYDPQGRRLYANAAWRRLGGAARDESLGHTVLDQPLMAEPEAYHRALLRAAAGTPAELRVEVDSPTVGHRVFDVRVLPEHGDDGRPASVLVIGRDIRERKRAEQALKQREREFRTLAEHLPEPIIRYALAHPDDRPRIEAAIAESARTLKPFHIEARICRPDGTER